MDKQKQLVNLFRLIVTKDPMATNEVVNTTPSLLRSPLHFRCGSPFDATDTGCACALDHETFSYISGEELNKEVLDNILESVVRRECSHHSSKPEEYKAITSVNLVHAAAVVGYIPVLEILLKLPDEPSLTQSSGASPLHLAILFQKILSILTILDLKERNLKNYCSRFWFGRRDKRNPNIIDYDYVSIFKFCLMMDDSTTAQVILQMTPLRASWVIDAMASKSENDLKLVLPYINSSFVHQLSYNDTNAIIQYAIKSGVIMTVPVLLDRLRSIRSTYKGVSLVLLATVYNQPEILQLLLTLKVDNGNIVILDYTLLDIANSIGHTECSDILMLHGIKTSSKSTTVSPFLVILEIGQQLPFSRRETTDLLIKKAGSLKQISESTAGDESLILHSLRHKRGLGARELLAVSNDIEVKGLDGLTPLALVMKQNMNPNSILDILYFNPILSRFEVENVERSSKEQYLKLLDWSMFRNLSIRRLELYNRPEERCPRERHLELFDRSKVKNISMLALAIERDLKNYSVRKRNSYSSEFIMYEGSMSVLLLDCGYDVRRDELVHSSYSKLLTGRHGSAREDEIRARILDRIEIELFRPKPLKERCRVVLRRAFTGHSLHRFVGAVNMPPSIKNFILMESRLKTLQ